MTLLPDEQGWLQRHTYFVSGDYKPETVHFQFSERILTILSRLDTARAEGNRLREALKLCIPPDHPGATNCQCSSCHKRKVAQAALSPQESV